MTAADVARGLRVATYERVSSDDQRERETIKTQRDALDRRLASEPDVSQIERYVDEAVSGSMNVRDRPDGSRLLRDAEAHRFDVLWVYRLDRLGRDLVDMAITGRRLRQLGIRLISMIEGEPDPFMFDIQAAFAENEKRIFRQRSADGMDRAAREGRYTGGIVAFGYVVPERRQAARLVPDTRPLSASLELAAVDVVRQVYRRLAIDGWTCREVAIELTALGVPTSYGRAGREVMRGARKVRTQEIWRAGRIRNLVREPKYAGRLEYGRRGDGSRQVISAAVPRLVSDELWQGAQDALERNRRVTRNSPRRYLLKRVITCGICSLTYSGSQGRTGVGWYRCNGQIAERGPIAGKCWGHSIRADLLEPIVWADVERFLRDPGQVLDELDATSERDEQGAVAEAERTMLVGQLERLAVERLGLIRQAARGWLTDDVLDAELSRVDGVVAHLQQRVAAVEAPQAAAEVEVAHTLLDEVRARLDAGLSDEQRQEIVRLLVGIRIDTTLPVDGARKSAKAVIEYRFPGVVHVSTGTGSWPRQEHLGVDPNSPQHDLE